MKWMLIVVVFGTTPVKTELVFGALEDCLRAEESMRRSYAEAYNNWLALSGEGAGAPIESNVDTERFQEKRLGLLNAATCIPHA
jgi:hypothetical protein